MAPDLVVGIVILAVGTAATALLARERLRWPALLLGLIVCLQGVRYVSAGVLNDQPLRAAVPMALGAAALGVSVYLYWRMRRHPPAGEAADRQL